MQIHYKYDTIYYQLTEQILLARIFQYLGFSCIKVVKWYEFWSFMISLLKISWYQPLVRSFYSIIIIITFYYYSNSYFYDLFSLSHHYHYFIIIMHTLLLLSTRDNHAIWPNIRFDFISFHFKDKIYHDEINITILYILNVFDSCDEERQNCSSLTRVNSC